MKPHQKLKAFILNNKGLKTATRAMFSMLYLGPWRNLVARMLVATTGKREILLEESSHVIEINPADCARKLKESGYSGAFRFSPELVDEVMDAIPAGMSDRVYNLHLTSPAVRAIAYDPKVIELVTGYLGVTPIVYESTLALINGSGSKQKEPGKPCNREFHYDVGDFRSLTLFVYLNDVDLDGGAHVVIPATHQSLPVAKYGSRYLSYRSACTRFGEDRMVSITGAKGTAFLEDLVNWHKRSLSNRRRYTLSVTYTLHRTPVHAQ